MNETHTTCSACGRMILSRTASHFDGLCRICAQHAANIPPVGFELSRPLVERAVSLGMDPSDFLGRAWQSGEESVHWYLDKTEEQRRLYAEWAPRLREFARECRATNPIPPQEALSRRQRAHQEVLRSVIESAPDRMFPHDESLVIFELPLAGIPVARRCWPGMDESAVFLTHEEWPRWSAIYDHPPDAFWWFTFQWWNVVDAPAADARWSTCGKLAVPEGHDPWIVVSGWMVGSLFGGQVADLWSWDGEHAHRVERVEESLC